MSTMTSRFFAVKTTGGQEKNVAKFVGNRLEHRKQSDDSSLNKQANDIHSILVIDANKKSSVYNTKSVPTNFQHRQEREDEEIGDDEVIVLRRGRSTIKGGGTKLN